MASNYARWLEELVTRNEDELAQDDIYAWVDRRIGQVVMTVEPAATGPGAVLAIQDDGSVELRHGGTTRSSRVGNRYELEQRFREAVRWVGGGESAVNEGALEELRRLRVRITDVEVGADEVAHEFARLIWAPAGLTAADKGELQGLVNEMESLRFGRYPATQLQFMGEVVDRALPIFTRVARLQRDFDTT
jgi:hypothetical protein